MKRLLAAAFFATLGFLPDAGRAADLDVSPGTQRTITSVLPRWIDLEAATNGFVAAWITGTELRAARITTDGEVVDANGSLLDASASRVPFLDSAAGSRDVMIVWLERSSEDPAGRIMGLRFAAAERPAGEPFVIHDCVRPCRVPAVSAIGERFLIGWVENGPPDSHATEGYYDEVFVRWMEDGELSPPTWLRRVGGVGNCWGFLMAARGARFYVATNNENGTVIDVLRDDRTREMQLLEETYGNDFGEAFAATDRGAVLGRFGRDAMPGYATWVLPGTRTLTGNTPTDTWYPVASVAFDGQVILGVNAKPRGLRAQVLTADGKLIEPPGDGGVELGISATPLLVRIAASESGHALVAWGNQGLHVMALVRGDGVGASDNCAGRSNPDQTDTDGDSIGDACDDNDGDALVDVEDNCPAARNEDQSDRDGDGFGDVCDPDDDPDGDGRADIADNCPSIANPTQEDADRDGAGDACDPDADDDGRLNDADNCPLVPNDQLDSDGDGIGDACLTAEMDRDGDAIHNDLDNCPDVANSQQHDMDGDGIGDACLPGRLDKDGDSWRNDLDNCPNEWNRGQQDDDGDGIGNHCDPASGTDAARRSYGCNVGSAGAGAAVPLLPGGALLPLWALWRSRRRVTLEGCARVLGPSSR